MCVELKYGENASIWLQLPAESLLVDASMPHGEPLLDPAAAVGAALAAPLGFPPLRQAVVSGDRIAVALDHGIPQVAAIVAGLVPTLLAGGALAADIDLVLPCGSDETLSAQAVAGLPAEVRRDVRLSIHNPHDPASLCYLAASKHGKPIYFNRHLCEADLVIPVGVQRLENSFAYTGVHGGLFPAFSDDESRLRFRSPASADWSAKRQRRRAEADEAAWLLGVQIVVQVTPGPGETVLQVLAGKADEVARVGRALSEAAWLHHASRRANLVVAAIEGGSEQQTWDNFARALFAASQAVVEGGAIVLCTDLREPPGPAMRRLAQLDGEPESLERSLRGRRSEDALSAILLAATIQRAKVYLLSGLDEGLVEDLGLGYVENSGEIQRLSRQYSSCILLGNAQFAMLATDDG